MNIKIKRVYEKPDDEDGRRILVEAEHREHGAALGVERSFGGAGFDALGDLFLGRALRLDIDPPQVCARNDMRGHRSERDTGMC